MHPYSPHAHPASRPTKATRPTAVTGRRAMGSPSRASAAGKGKYGNPLDALAAEIESKFVPNSMHTTHIAAQALTLRRPRRPAAMRASFRTPPSS